MCLLAHELAINSDVQECSQNELDFTHEEHGSFFYETFSKLKYLDMVVREMLRK